MRRIYKAAAIVVLTLATIVSCRNAEAQNVKELTSDTFNTTVYNVKAESLEYLGEKPAIIDFTATWCGPCRQLAPILEEIANDNAGKIDVYKVDVDKCRDIAQAFGISSIPAILYIPVDGEAVMTIGGRSKTKMQTEVDRILLGK